MGAKDAKNTFQTQLSGRALAWHGTGLIPSTAKGKTRTKPPKVNTALGRASGEEGRQAWADLVTGMRHQLLNSIERKRNSKMGV